MQREKWNARYASRPLVWSAEPNGLFVELVRDRVPGRALDIGCGEGRNALWLAEHGWHVMAVDISDTGIDKARLIARERGVDVNFVRADIADAGQRAVVEAAAPFDLVACVFMHTDAATRDRWLPAMLDLIAPGGSFVHVGHDRSNIEHGAGGPQDPDLLLTPELLAGIAHNHGLVVERAEVHRRRLADDPGHGGGAADRPALDTLFVARRPSR